MGLVHAAQVRQNQIGITKRRIYPTRRPKIACIQAKSARIRADIHTHGHTIASINSRLTVAAGQRICWRGRHG
jgi:hypothetical protein